MSRTAGWWVLVIVALAAVGAVRPVPAEDAKPAEPAAISKAEQELIDLTNAERKKHDLPPLAADPELMAIARRHTANMVRLNTLSHELEGKNFVQRMEDAGYKSLRSGENVAEGYPTPAKVIAGWMDSPGHRANILGSEFTHVGVGMVKASSGRYYYTQVFAKPFPKK